MVAGDEKSWYNGPINMQGSDTMDRLGQVTRVDGEWIEVTFCRPSDCEKCHACMGGPHETTIRLKGDAQVGNMAQVSMPDSMITKAGVLAYALPLAGLLVGMTAGNAIYPSEQSIGAIIGAVVGILIPAVWLFVTDKKRQQDPKWTPQLVRVIPQGEPNE